MISKSIGPPAACGGTATDQVPSAITECKILLIITITAVFKAKIIKHN